MLTSLLTTSGNEDFEAIQGGPSFTASIKPSAPPSRKPMVSSSLRVAWIQTSVPAEAGEKNSSKNKEFHWTNKDIVFKALLKQLTEHVALNSNWDRFRNQNRNSGWSGR